jgi:hypothetical protein
VNTLLLTPTTQSWLTTRLTDLVSAAAARPDLRRPLVRFSELDRCWSRPEGRADVDLWLLTWTRSQSTDLHDHGRSTAARPRCRAR